MVDHRHREREGARLLTLVQLKYFKAVCQYNNITKAAAALYVSQPSVSNAIKDLEEEFGVQLFYRLSKGLSLTEEGWVFLEMTERVLDASHSLERKMQDMGSKRKEITIGIPPMIGTILFPHLYQSFHKAYPEIRLSIVEHGSVQTRRMVAGGALDIAIVAVDKGAGDFQSFDSVKVVEIDSLFCVSANHPLASEASVSIGMIRKEPLVLFKEDSHQSGSIKRQFASISAEPNVILYSSQLHTIKELITNGVASSVLFRGVVGYNEGIVSIPFDKPLISDIYLIWNKDKHLFSDLTRFIDFTKAYDFKSKL